ncbi:MAG TPA: DUF4038 domain-containing protein [Opitutus sp.]|nr:DUF4038 domain-containing protein [Opitutus sp.]
MSRQFTGFFPLRWTLIAIAVALAGGVVRGADDVAPPPLRISENHRYLIDAQGKPFFLQGDAAWSLIANTTREETIRYLDDRRAKGFTAIVVNLLEHKFAKDPPRDLYGEAPFADVNDWTTTNEKYFAHADWAIREAGKRGITVFLFPVYLGYEGRDEGFYDEVLANGPEKCLAYGRFVGQRYRDFDNIIWVMGGDRDPGTAREDVDLIAYGMREFDRRHLYTAHCHSDSNIAAQFPTSTWIDLNSTYTYNIVHLALTWNYQRTPVRPNFLLETEYEGPTQFATELQVRRAGYWSILCGGFGYVMGNFPRWLFDPGWPATLEAPSSVQMTHWGDLFRSRRWWELVPDADHKVVTDGLGEQWGLDTTVAASTPDGKLVIAYMTAARTITVDLAKMSAAEAKAWWYNPRLGEATSGGAVKTGAPAKFTPPGEGDWALVLDDASSNLAAPGRDAATR